MEALTEAAASSLTKALDQVGETPGLLRRREVATGKLSGLDRIAEPLPSQAQLPCLESVLAAADDVETHFSPEFRDNAREIPSFSVLAVFVHEGALGALQTGVTPQR